MDKVVWKDKNGWHVMAGDSDKLEEKRREIEESKDREDRRDRLLR